MRATATAGSSRRSSARPTCSRSSARSWRTSPGRAWARSWPNCCRAYHGSTGNAVQATGDPRRWPNEQGGAVVHVLDPYHGIQRGWDSADEALANLEEAIQLEGPSTIAAFIFEPIT